MPLNVRPETFQKTKLSSNSNKKVNKHCLLNTLDRKIVNKEK